MAVLGSYIIPLTRDYVRAENISDFFLFFSRFEVRKNTYLDESWTSETKKSFSQALCGEKNKIFGLNLTQMTKSKFKWVVHQWFQH